MNLLESRTGEPFVRSVPAALLLRPSPSLLPETVRVFESMKPPRGRTNESTAGQMNERVRECQSD